MKNHELTEGSILTDELIESLMPSGKNFIPSNCIFNNEFPFYPTPSGSNKLSWYDLYQASYEAHQQSKQ